MLRPGYPHPPFSRGRPRCVSSPTAIFPVKGTVLELCTANRYSNAVQINGCRRCGSQWCYRGEGRALRCGKCGSPYWDKERLNVGDAGVDGEAEAGDNARRGVGVAAVSDVRVAAKPAKRLRAVQPVRGELAGGRGSDQKPKTEPGAVSIKCVLPGHTCFKNGDGWYCMTCAKASR